MEFNFTAGQSQVPQEKVQDLCSFVNSMTAQYVKNNGVHRRTLAQLAGKLNFALMGCFWAGRLRHSLIVLLNSSSHKGWDKKVHLNSTIIQDLQWAKTAL